ncbi:tRNA preQ1(34) S-adenosylmethionine ribosyltransferase-isomerase QueA [Bermanella marisrubri]|uniref:S-adenosylmethionine:tRNA ribosyltransferase-isomerase n=1 Tax=Bermanella marisrubri TaxID=207949 RepID=Q1MY63_9GAMM|nr:tRNA preQ1(34) S-adenosylmethionine ribosyltransferase-isomerase QueA [Bermanella marisrubri]EAT10897.1 S-adenosylmethionine:tRNA-ribosyltransferase-isomerase [Oceanobacter sp. RED65] [Bermanella marisrubri]QIZ85335.1 tRNA preQ1(34) S-adenosylmethionine ribosyltransferase-isomerase QueA [Bermanella marisrubri]
MKTSDFHFELPQELIAQYPPKERTSSRLLCVNSESGRADIQHKVFKDILAEVQPGDLMVFNNTRVIPARLFGEKESGGKLEVLIERMTGTDTALVHMKSSRSPKPGSTITLEGLKVSVEGRQDALFELKFHLAPDQDLVHWLEQVGHMPLPPYMEREDEDSDRERYQTVYNEKPGAVAAPTAGLHFDDALLNALKDKGVGIAFVTLHVGAGTFQPVKVDDVNEHKMHSEYLEVSEETCEAIRKTKALGKKVIAVGTTSVRSLETASQSGEIQPYQGDTEIFIYPGYQFKTVDRLLTNFHLPESTLIMLVSAFVGRGPILNAYDEAVREQYRFFSYGDAMLLDKNPNAEALWEK